MADEPDGTQPLSSLVRDVVAEVAGGRSDGTLASLTREELFTLADEPTLEHAGDVAWWAGLDDTARDLVRQTAERGLVARRLLTAAPDGESFTVDARVQLVLRARAEPSWLLVLGEPANSEVQIVAHGIDLDERETAAVLVSARIEGVYLNRLLPPAGAVDVVADWLLRATPAAQPTGRTIELITPHLADDGQREQHTRAIVLGNADEFVLAGIDPADGTPGEPTPVDHGAVHAWLAARLPIGAPTT